MLFGKHINKYYLRYFPWLLLGMLSLIMVDFSQLLIPPIYGMAVNGIKDGYVMVDNAAVIFDMDFVLDRICLPMIVIILCMVAGRFLWRICFFGAGIRVETALRSEMFDHCKDLSQDFYQKNKVGNMMSLFTNDIETVQDCFGMGIMMFVDAAFLGVMSLYKMYKMDPVLTGLSLIPLGLLLAGSLLLSKYLSAKWDKRQAAFSALSDFSQESFSGIAVIKAYVKEAKELMKFSKLNRDNEDRNIEYTRLSVLMRITVTLLVESVICVVLGYGVYLVYIKQFNAGDLVEYIGYFNSVIWPIMAVSELIDMYSRGKASLDRIGELLDAKIDVKDASDAAAMTGIKGNIEFKNLTFRYPDSEVDVLTDVSFKINAGENVGVVGKTGSGKTTLVDLILRTYNVPDGTLFIDGRDVNSAYIKDIRAAAAYVPQDNFLFSDTIENNIAFASDDVTADGVINAAKLSDIDENIMEFSEKYKTVLGERGVTVSGGQKQRISIARALMKNAPILILDDSVSAVDVKTEKVILENLRRERAGKTTILIAHRITTIENMDKIIFIDDGKIVDVGTHRELYGRSEDYKTMVDLQRLDDIEASHDSDLKEVGSNA